MLQDDDIHNKEPAEVERLSKCLRSTILRSGLSFLKRSRSRETSACCSGYTVKHCSCGKTSRGSQKSAVIS